MNKTSITESQKHYFSFLTSKYVGQAPDGPQLHNIDCMTQHLNSRRNDGETKLTSNTQPSHFSNNRITR